MPPANEILNTRPRLLRSTIARGLAAGDQPVDRTGGDFGAGIVRGMAILTRGEALGHGLWCDRVMLSQVATAINASANGAKARFTHPDLSGDGLGKGLGRVKNASLDGDVVRGDLHFSQASHNTPDGDLAGYVMLLALEDPQAFGNSIAFDEDYVAEDKFRAEHSIADGDGYPEFKSPDPENVHNFQHARVASLRAVDAVDDPAANPNGLFHRGDEIARDAERLLSWTLGLSAEKPQLVSLDLDPERVGGFVQRFMARHGLTLITKEGVMPNPKFAAFTADLAKQLAADNQDRDEKKEKAGQEEGDAEKDEGQDKTKDEGQGDFDAGDDGDSEDGEAGKKKMATKCAAGQAAQLAEGGEDPPKGGGEADEEAIQKKKQAKQNEVAEKSKADAKEGTPIQSPGSDKSAIGPMGDASSDVGYSAPADGTQFLKAFGPQGAVWFVEGKTFAQATELHIKALAKENADLKSRNAQLEGKAQERRGLAAPLNAGGDTTSVSPEHNKLTQNLGSGMARFALPLQEQLDRIKNRRN